MTRLRARDWDVPGGHLEAGETPEAAMRREVYEETAARLGVARVLAHIGLRVLAPRPDGYRYPHPESFMVFYLAPVAALESFTATAEASARRLFPPAAVRRLRWCGATPCCTSSPCERPNGRCECHCGGGQGLLPSLGLCIKAVLSGASPSRAMRFVVPRGLVPVGNQPQRLVWS